MSSISDNIADSFITYAVDLDRYTASAEKEVRSFLNRLEIELVSILNTHEITTPTNSSRSSVRLKLLLGEVRQSLGGIYRELWQYTELSMLEISKLEDSVISKIINDSVGTTLITSGLTQEVLQSIASNALIAGTVNKEWWSRQEDKISQKFADQVRMGIALGESTSDIVARIRGKATGNRVSYKTSDGKTRYKTRFVGGIMDVTTRDAVSLVRTSIQTASQQARQEMYKKHSDVIRGQQALVTLDGNTTITCISRSGKSWTLAGVGMNGTVESFPGPTPWHWQCRTTLIPILYGFDELGGRISPKRKKLIRDNVSKSTQASMDGQVAGDLTYEKWLKTKNKSFQQELLGPTRYKLWKDQGLSFKQMVDNRARPISIKVLKEKYL